MKLENCGKTILKQEKDFLMLNVVYDTQNGFTR